MIRAIVDLDVPVQASGGAATADEIHVLLDAGAGRVVLGSAALADRVLVTGLAERIADRLAIGVETDGERIRSRGRRSVDLPLTRRSGGWAETAAERFVVTGVPRVGRLTGPDLEGLRAVVALGRPAIERRHRDRGGRGGRPGRRRRGCDRRAGRPGGLDRPCGVAGGIGEAREPRR